MTSYPIVQGIVMLDGKQLELKLEQIKPETIVACLNNEEDHKSAGNLTWQVRRSSNDVASRGDFIDVAYHLLCDYVKSIGLDVSTEYLVSSAEDFVNDNLPKEG